MTLSNQERAVRCQQAITAYSDDDTYTNLVDFLADAMHCCHLNGRSFPNALDTAVMHFEAEMTSVAIAKATGEVSADLRKPIVIEVRGGVVQDVLNVPPGIEYEIRDYDNHEETD